MKKYHCASFIIYYASHSLLYSPRKRKHDKNNRKMSSRAGFLHNVGEIERIRWK